MASFQVALLQTNAHWQDLGVWHFRFLGPVLLPARQMTFVESVRSRNFAFCPDACCLMWEWASHSLEDEAAGKSCHKRMKQHDA